MLVSFVKLIQSNESMSVANPVNKSIVKKLRFLKPLNEEKCKIFDTMTEPFSGRKKLKDPLAKVLQDVPKKCISALV